MSKRTCRIVVWSSFLFSIFGVILVAIYSPKPTPMPFVVHVGELCWWVGMAMYLMVCRPAFVEPDEEEEEEEP